MDIEIEFKDNKEYEIEIDPEDIDDTEVEMENIRTETSEVANRVREDIEL